MEKHKIKVGTGSSSELMDKFDKFLLFLDDLDKDDLDKDKLKLGDYLRKSI